tara:strand:- start:172 stop:531 length:360 start_codon:yes stop_codon:yes gene_type:complete
LADIPLVDVGKVQRRLDAKKDNPYTVLEGSCHVPVDASSGLKKAHLKTTAGTFLNTMSKRGYELTSQLRLNGPYPAVEMDSDVVIEDMEEWRIRAVFKKDKPEFTRIELDPAIIGEDNG